MSKEVGASCGQERCALVLASNVTDGAVIARVLAHAGVETINYATAEELLSAARAGVGIIIITEEALVGMALELLEAFFEEEPPWSQVPFIVLTAPIHSPSRMPSWRRRVADFPFVRSATLLERPLRAETLIQSARVAMRSRDRQYQLRNYLAEREQLLARTYTLFRELQHRVRNNLQVVQSLVRLSAKRAPADLEEYFEEVRRQIWAIGQVHHKLYAGGYLDHIDLSSYIADISDLSLIGFGSVNDRVRIKRQLEPISVEVDAAIPIGLIVTELLTNALKYAFPGERCGEIRICLVSRSGYGELTIMDDGVGLAEQHKGTGLGIVQALVTQIEGDLEFLKQAGTRWIPRFPLGKEMAKRQSA
jgi:two-component sensor histidine kinase